MMPWYAWVLIASVVLDRLLTVALCGRNRKIDITPTYAVVSLIIGALIIWAVVALGTAA